MHSSDPSRLHKIEQTARIAHSFAVRMRHFFEGSVFGNKIFVITIESDECSKISYGVTVVGSRENCDALIVVGLKMHNKSMWIRQRR